MTSPHDAIPVRVQVGNWPEKRRKVEKTTVKTWVLDPTGVAGPKDVQICDYEPKRVRLTIRPVDIGITVTTDSPTSTPDTTTASLAPQGAYLPANPTGVPEEFFGPDAFWINSLTAVTRVVVKKEYC